MISMITTLVWDGYLHTTTVDSLMWSTQMRLIAIVASLPRQKAGQNRTSDGWPHNFSDGRDKSFECDIVENKLTINKHFLIKIHVD